MSDGFDPSYFSKLFELEKKSFWFRARNKFILWALRRYFPDMCKFLEIGCGTGYVLSAIEKEFPGLDLYGGEFYDSGLQCARNRVRRASLIQVDAKAIRFRNEFDVIGAFDVLEHIPEDEVVLSEMFQAVRPGGGILLTVPQHPFLWSRFDVFSHHVRRYSAKDLGMKIERAGFRILSLKSFVSLLFPLLLLSRLKRSGARDAYDGFKELKVSQPLNFICEKVLDFERVMVSWGISFPFGGSLLLAARKS